MRHFINLTNGLFLVFLLVQILPDTIEKRAESRYLTAFVISIEILFLLYQLVKKKSSEVVVKDVIAVIYTAVIVWVLLTAKFNILNELFFPAPGAVVKQTIDDLQKLLSGLVSSLRIILSGYLYALVSGIMLGLVAGWNRRVGGSLNYVSKFLGSIPPIVYIPYAIALLPTFQSASVFVIFAASFWSIFGSTMNGVMGVDKDLIESAKALNVKPLPMLFQVMLPAALPQVLLGCSQGLSVSFILLASAEMIGGKSGIGFYIKYYSDFGDFTRIVTGIIFLGCIVSVVTFLFNRIQNYLLRWRF